MKCYQIHKITENVSKIVKIQKNAPEFLKYCKRLPKLESLKMYSNHKNQVKLHEIIKISYFVCKIFEIQKIMLPHH